MVMTESDNIYKGYRYLSGTTDEVNKYLEDTDGWLTNEYLIIDDVSIGKFYEMRFNGEKFVPLKLPDSKYIKGKNPHQRCALDMLNNPNITICVLLGTYGSGKSYLAMKMGLYAIKNKGYQKSLLCIREPYGEGRELGYLPGTFENKNQVWTLPLVQQLDGKDWELNQLKQQGIIDFNIPLYMKGCSYDDTIMVCDESEDLTRKQLKMIGTRVAEGSRIFFDGDYRQSAIPESSPLLQMCNALKGNPLFACMTLEDDVRSDTSKLFANIFED